MLPYTTLYFVVLRISIPKKLKSICLKWKYRHSGNDNRVVTLSKSHLTTIGINKFEIDRTISTILN